MHTVVYTKKSDYEEDVLKIESLESTLGENNKMPRKMKLECFDINGGDLKGERTFTKNKLEFLSNNLN